MRGCGNGDIAARAMELVRRIYGRHARRTDDALFALLHLQYRLSAHIDVVGIHWFQDRAHPARRSKTGNRADSLAEPVLCSCHSSREIHVDLNNRGASLRQIWRRL